MDDRRSSTPAGRGNPILSHTSIMMYLRCPAQYFFRYIEGIKMPPTGAVVFGIAFDRTISYNYEKKILSGEDEHEDVLTDFFAEEYEAGMKEVEEKVDEKDIGVQLVREYRKSISVMTSPKSVQCGYERDFEAVTITGIVDLQTTDGKIVDVKTSRYQTSGITATQRIQLGTYAFLTDSANAIGEIHLGVVSKTPRVLVLREVITSEDIRLALSIAQAVYRGIQSGVFPPNRTSFACSRRTCGYWRLCEQRFGGRVRD